MNLIDRPWKFCATLHPGDTLLDIGANIGYVSACFLNNVPDSKTIAVEPQPQILDLLQHNLKQFGSDRYQVVPVALSDTDGDGWLEICDYNRGASKLVAERGSRSTSVGLWSAAELFSNLAKVDLIKIDVEGHEEEILRSCANALKQLKPRAIVFEEHSTKSAPNGSIGILLTDAGYQIFGVRKRLTRLDLVPIRDFKHCKFNDYVAVSIEREIPSRAARAYGTRRNPFSVSNRATT